MRDSSQVTDALVRLYAPNDWVTNLNFRVLMRLSGLRSVPRDAKLLDCGCAMGHFMALLQRYGFAQVSGLDASPEMAEHARQLTQRPVACADVLRLSVQFPPGSFDVITAMNLQHHLGREAEWEAFIGECRKALKPGGRLLVREPSPTWLFNCLWRISQHQVFFKVGLLRRRLESLVEERALLDYFLAHWPAFYRPCLERHGFQVTKDFCWMGHRVVVSRL